MNIKEKNRQNKGITLIALVITIIVMLILVAVSISMAVNGGLFNFAGKASKETQNAIDAEQELSSGKIKVGDKWYASIDDYLKGQAMPSAYEEAEFDGEYLAENAIYTSGNYTAVIPKGFKIIPGINNTTTIADGLVIQDKEGNEFVWIPVKYTEEGTLDEDGYDTGFKKAFYRSDWASNSSTGGKRGTTLGTSYKEPLTSGGYENEETDYKEMLNSVYNNGGFYIGRYEAGIKTTGSPRTDSTEGTTTGWVVQRNCYPYTYVGWGPTMTSYTGDVTDYSRKNRGSGALELCKNFYTEEDKVGVTSTLCYGIMWDTMLDFIKDSSHNVTNSTTWGNYQNNAWTTTNENAWYSEDDGETWTQVSSSGKTKDSSTQILLTTGASDNFAAKNIYDVAGNVFEWTNEAVYDGYGHNRVTRGGSYLSSGSIGPASLRINFSPGTYSFLGFGFRPVLYITDNK